MTSEHTLQVHLLQLLDTAARPEVYWFAIPNAGRRSLRMGAHMKHEGLKSGVADLCFMLPAGKSAWLELKKPGSYQTIEQKGFQARCARLEHPYAVAKTLDQAVENRQGMGCDAMNVLDLFSGIGGFSLGLERAGFTTVAFCEIDPYCRKILARHWPDVPVYDDVRTLTAARLVADAAGKSANGHARRASSKYALSGNAGVDVICGGFPCQDISTAGKGAGITGERSGLWREYARIIGEVRPRYVIVENVAALLHRGLGDVLGDLSALGYDAEWHCIPASAVGAPHRRDRVWIIAHPQHSDADGERPYRAPQHIDGSAELRDQQVSIAGSVCEDVAYAAQLHGNGGKYHAGSDREGGRTISEFGNDCRNADVADADSNNGHGRRGAVQMGWGRIAREIADNGEFGRTQWGIEPDVGRVAHGVPNRVHRLRALGNAVVPQIPELIGRAIMRAQP